MITQLDLYILNNDNSVAPFPSEAEQIVLYDFAFEAQRMGSAPEITATIQANGSMENSLTTKVFCEYNGERYFLKNLPSSAKENTDPRYTFDLTFVSERTILDNVYMIDAVQGDSNIDRYQSNSTNIVFMGTIEESVARLNAAMTYAGVGYSVVLDEGITTESKLVSFQDKFFTEALQEIVNIHNIPYYYVGKVIHFGWSQTTIPTLKYGDGLLSINKSIRTERIVNRATATGSTENIPYYYPNPTPKGFINPSITDKSGAGISVINEAKLSRLDENQKLSYYEFTTVDIVKTAFSIESINYPSSGQGYLPKVDWDAPNVSSGIINTLGNSWLIVGIDVQSSIEQESDVYVKYYLSFKSEAAKYVEIRDVIAYIKEGDDLIIDTTLHPEIKGGGILIPNFPTNTERYIAVRYYNSSTNKYEFKFNFESTNYLSSGWYISDGNDRINDSEVNIFDYGISVSNTPKEGDEVSYSVIKKIPVATTLMPPIYRESNGEQRFYNAINGVYEGITFENEYSAENPKEAITKFEDIKPTIVGVTNANGERIDMFAEFAYDLNDSDETEQTDENSESFIHPYFYAKLHKIDGDNGFNLFAQAIESGEMTIEMTSGHCGACKFVIAVDENTQRNLVMVDDNGNLIYDDATGKVKMADDATGLDRQNDTQNYDVWIALKKDINTFGTVMPMANSTIKPSVDDTFVITNILLPQAYFTAAEKKLEDEIIAFLVKNNAFQFECGINFSRIFLKKRNDVFSLLTENACIPIEYNGNKLSFYVSSYTYRKQKGEVLPEISVSLTDNFDSTPSAFQQSINAIQENIVRGIGAVGLTLEDTDPRYLRKDVADIVKERTTFEKGMDFGGTLTSKGFKKGNLIGAGFGVYTDENGNTVVEADRMVIRKDAQFSEIVINQTTFQLGTTVFSGGGCNITNVEEVEGAYRCYYDNKSGTRFSGFVVGDQARCQRFDESFGGVIKYYWRLVVAVGTDYVDLSKTDVDGGGVPESGDDIVNFGNRIEKSRQNAIVINPLNGGSVEVYAGINSFSLEDKNYVGMGVNPNTNEAYMYGYGDIYIGDRNIDADDATFVTYQKKEGEIKRKVFISADVNLGKNSTGLSNLSEFQDVKKEAQDAKQAAQNAESSAKSYADELVKDLQDQLDGKVESYFFDYDPTTSNIPASEWTTDELKEEHLNDTFTNTDSGQSWRWLFKDGSYQWVEIADTQSAEALAKAQEALGVANGKVAVFVTEPRSPYNEKDLWLQGEDGRIKRCTFTRTTTGEFYAEDWVNADDSHEYTDSEIAKYKKSVDATIESLDAAIDAAEEASKDYTDEGKKALQASIDALNNAKANATDVYDKATADGLINQAEADAIAAAQELANAAQALAEETAKAYADGVVDAEEEARIKQAQENLNAAKEYAEGKAKEAEDNAKEYADSQISSYDLTIKYLKDAFNKGSVLDVNGVTLSALVGVKDENDAVVAGLYGGASDVLNNAGYADATHGAMLLFGGIEGVDKPKTYKTAIFEDGYIESTMFATGRSGKRVEIFGNELKVYGDDANASVLSISYDSTGKPRLQYTDKSGNVAWYLSDSGISTSYTVAQADNTFVKLAGDAQSITAQHNFTNGLKIGGISLRKVDNYLYLNSSLVLSGSVTMYGDDGTTVKPIWESIPFDRTTIDWVDGKWTVVGGVGSGGISEEFLNVKLQEYQPLLSTTNKLPYSLISGTPDLSVYALKTAIPTKLSQLTDDLVAGKYLSLSGGTMSGSITTRTNTYSWSTAKTNGHIIAGHSPSVGFAPIISTGLQSGGYGKLGQVGDIFGIYAYSLEGTSPSVRIELMPEDGNVRIYGHINPYTTNSYDLGNSNAKWGNIYATSFIGDLKGTASGNLPLTGGTLTSSDVPLNISRVSNTASYSTIGYMLNGTMLGYLGFDNNGGLIASPNRTTNNAYYSILHSGNYSDLLAGGTINGDLDISGNLTSSMLTAEGARLTDHALLLATSDGTFTNTVGFSSNQLRIGYGSANNYQMQTWLLGYGIIFRAQGGTTNTLVLSSKGSATFNGSVTAPSFIGNLTGNADSATKLATARTIWGQSFDGTKDITGAMTVDGDATFSSKVVIGTIPVYQSADGTLFVDANVVFRGGVAMYGDTTTTVNEE